MKDLRGSILNRGNIVSRGIEVTNAETLCKLLFDFINDQKFQLHNVESTKSDTSLSTYIFVKRDLKKDIANNLFNKTLKLFADQNIKYKHTFQYYTAQYVINIEPKNLSYPNIKIVSYYFKSGSQKHTYNIFFYITAPKEYIS